MSSKKPKKKKKRSRFIVSSPQAKNITEEAKQELDIEDPTRTQYCLKCTQGEKNILFLASLETGVSQNQLLCDYIKTTLGKEVRQARRAQE